ncbi:hypothetical protein QNK01_10200 [Desemzia incerta]|uniref:YqgU-like beta propeller domain-containing protein n=1 Tax=Desemzia TaxID=82800 RepID=UPI001E499536|nr:MULTISPECIES: hypothetical protein [Desemzia]MCI3029930.1 hypothetical protein [Desemzia sp. C1]WHZ31837.1 hypothetical protein QNK01_10200 [Desemzia incerta]
MKQPTISRLAGLLLIIVFFLSACHSQEDEAAPSEDGETGSNFIFEQIPLDKEEFRKIIGWKSTEEVIVQAGGVEGDSLYSFNILTGDFDLFYEVDSFILASRIVMEEEKVIIQLVKDANSSLIVVNFKGDVLQELEIQSSGFVDINVNAQNPSLAFISYYEGENNTAVYNWNMTTNEYTEVESASLEPKWYSENLYLFIDNGEDFSLETGELYMGDIRSDEILLLDSYASDFYLHEDSFIKFTPSDFNEQEIMLTYQYPFLVDAGFMVVPKVTMNERIIFPYLTQAVRDSAIYGIFAQEAVSLEEEAGKFMFSEIDFENGKLNEIVKVPENAPILISENGKYCLFGWSYEMLIDIENQQLYEMLSL